MKSLLSKYVLCFVVGAEVSAAAYGAPPNLIQNPDFDTSLNGWSEDNSSAIWTNNDYQGSSNSGAVLIGVPALFPTLLMQCVTLNGSGVYVAKAWAKSACGADAELDLYTADGQCTASTNYLSETTSTSGIWQPLELATTIPNGVTNVIVVLQNNGACHDNVYFDGISLLSDHVFADNFEIVKESQ